MNTLDAIVTGLRRTIEETPCLNFPPGVDDCTTSTRTPDAFLPQERWCASCLGHAILDVIDSLDVQPALEPAEPEDTDHPSFKDDDPGDSL